MADLWFPGTWEDEHHDCVRRVRRDTRSGMYKAHGSGNIARRRHEIPYFYFAE